MDVGVASPRAHGQAMTKIAIAGSNALAAFPGSTIATQIMNVKTAIPTTIGTKMPEMKVLPR